MSDPFAPGQMSRTGRPRRLLDDWGDRLCCAALVVAALTGGALLAWYVRQMPPLH